MFNKKYYQELAQLNNEKLEQLIKAKEEIENELTIAKAATTREYNDAIIELGIAQAKIRDLEKDLKNAMALQHQFYDECGKKEDELRFYKHIVRAAMVLSQNHIDFVVRHIDNGAYVEIHTFDTDCEPVNVLLKDGYWNIESPDGLNGMLIKGNHYVSMMDIILTEVSEDEEEKEVYRISFDSNQLESL